jgi:hypothetical protein
MHALVAKSIDSEDPLSAFNYVQNHPKPLLHTASTVIVHVTYAGVDPFGKRESSQGHEQVQSLVVY